MSRKQKGFTIIELMIVIAILVIVAVAGSALYTLIHFIAKFW